MDFGKIVKKLLKTESSILKFPPHIIMAEDRVILTKRVK